MTSQEYMAMGHKCPPFFDFAIMVRISSTAPVPDVAHTSALKYGQVLQTAHRKVPGMNGCGQKWAVFFEVAISCTAHDKGVEQLDLEQHELEHKCDSADTRVKNLTYHTSLHAMSCVPCCDLA